MRRVCGVNPGGLSWADDWSRRVRGGVLSPAQGQRPWEVTGLVSAGTTHIWRRLKAFNSRPRQEVSVSHRGTPQFSVLPPDFSLLPRLDSRPHCWGGAAGDSLGNLSFQKPEGMNAPNGPTRV